MTREEFVKRFEDALEAIEISAPYRYQGYIGETCEEVLRSISPPAKRAYARFLGEIFKNNFNAHSLAFALLNKYMDDASFEEQEHISFLRALCLAQWYEHVLETEEYKGF